MKNQLSKKMITLTEFSGHFPWIEKMVFQQYVEHVMQLEHIISGCHSWMNACVIVSKTKQSEKSKVKT